MKRLVHKYAAIFRINFLNKIMYVADVAGEAPLIMMKMWIFTQLYVATYATQHAQVIEGLSIAQIIWILLIVHSCESVTYDVADVIDDEVKSGGFSYTIIRPYSYMGYHFCAYVGKALPSLAVNLIAGLPVVYFLVGGVSCSFLSIIAATILLMGGATLTFFTLFSIGIGAFWIEETKGLVWIYHKAVMVLGGMVIPLSLLPHRLRAIAEFLPFGQTYYSAAQVLVKFDGYIFLKNFSIQLFWLWVMGSLATFLFYKGIRHVSAHGG